MTCAKAKRREKYKAEPSVQKKASAKYYYANREKEIARTRRWQAENPDKVKAYIARRPKPKPELRRAQRLRKLYGMTVADREAMFESQGRKCAACGSTKPNAKQGWHIDHCHETNLVRGILCQNCNVGLGHARHDPAVLKGWLRYLRNASLFS